MFPVCAKLGWFPFYFAISFNVVTSFVVIMVNDDYYFIYGFSIVWIQWVYPWPCFYVSLIYLFYMG